MKKYLFIIPVIALLTMVSCGPKEEKAIQQKEEKVKVKVSSVTEETIKQVEEFTATVEPEVKNNIVPAAPGRIRKIMVEVGANVKKGQKLAQMDVANLSNLDSQLENYKRMYKRVSELFAVGGASQQELDNARLQLTIAETNLSNLQENTYLISPISGVITTRNYDSGDIYNGQMPILTVMQINPVQIKINVSESFYSLIKTGMSVDVKLDVFKEQTFEGKVQLIYPTIDERTRTFQVEVRVNNASQKIRPGMFARVGVDFGKVNQVVVPDLAVIKQTGSGARYVYVLESGKVKYHEVKLGKRLGDKYIVLSGLTKGEQVVVAGLTKLNDGKEVEVVQ